MKQKEQAEKVQRRNSDTDTLIRLSHEVGVMVTCMMTWKNRKKSRVKEKLRKGNDKKLKVLDEKQVKDC